MIQQDMSTQLERSGVGISKLLLWYGVSRSTFYGWSNSSGTATRSEKRYNPASILESEEHARAQKDRHLIRRKISR